MFCLPCAPAAPHAASNAIAATTLNLTLCIWSYLGALFYLGALLGLVPPLRWRRRIGLVHGIQVSRSDLAFGTALQIVIEVLPILLHGGDAAEVGHALLWSAI